MWRGWKKKAMEVHEWRWHTRVHILWLSPDLLLNAVVMHEPGKVFGYVKLICYILYRNAMLCITGQHFQRFAVVLPQEGTKPAQVLKNTCFSASTYHENTCFCQGPCSYSGLMNVSACRYGAPAFVSLPHFLYGDPVLRQNLSGLRPDPEKHAFYFSVEPVSIQALISRRG